MYGPARVEGEEAPKEIRHLVAAILHSWPEVTILLVETNQGGDTWADIFSGLPVKFREVKQTTKKEVRAVVLLNGYQKREVVHAEKLPALDAELLAFPTGLNDISWTRSVRGTLTSPEPNWTKLLLHSGHVRPVTSRRSKWAHSPPPSWSHSVLP